MALVLVRIDDRLIHGQVSVGWAQTLQPDRIVLANDAVAIDPALRDLYAMAAPPDVAISILSIEEAVCRILGGCFASERTILIVESPQDALALRLKGVIIQSVNVGGLHHADGKRCMLPYLFVSDDDVRAFRGMLAQGMEVACQDVPSARKVDLRSLLQRSWSWAANEQS